MKKNLLVLFFISACGIINSAAQITLTVNDVASIGDTIKIARDTFPTGVSVGSPGASAQNWDFSNLNAHEVDVNAFIDPSTTAASSDFPNSNLAIDMNSGTLINYVSKNTGYLSVDGFYGDPVNAGANVAIIFNPPSKMLEFPSTLGNSFNDTTKFDFYFSDPQLLAFGIDSIRIAHAGYATRTMDAFGSVITVEDTFDCLRQYSFEILVDSIFMHPVGGQWQLVPESLLPPDFGFTSNPNIDTTYTYNWFANGEGLAVARIVTDTAGGTATEASFKTTNLVSGKSELYVQNGFSFYPNPSSGLFYATSNANKPMDISVINLLGQELYIAKNAGPSATINLSHLDNGLYIINIRSGNEFISRRIDLVK